MKIIPLTQGKVALVDDEDFERLNQFKWHTAKRGNNIFYAARTTSRKNIKRKNILMHREILRLTDPTIFPDHINHNGLDNRKHNLRQCTQQQNLCNQRKTRGSSQYKGVSWHKCDNRWRAYIKINSKYVHLGHFYSEHHAALAYNVAALNHFGVFAHVNELPLY